jgi:hypothetical protein
MKTKAQKHFEHEKKRENERKLSRKLGIFSADWKAHKDANARRQNKKHNG